MKNIFLLICLLNVFQSCVTNSTTYTNTNQSVSSPEADARKITAEMKEVLSLDTIQEDKVLMINVVNFTILKKLRESNQVDQINTTREKYRNEIKEVLNSIQYNKFLETFGNL